MDIRERPLFTDTYSNISEFIPTGESAYIYGAFPEERSTHVQVWEAKTSNVKFVRIEEREANDFVTEIDNKIINISLRNKDQLQNLFIKLGRRIIYLDITGLSHHIWAPLLLMALETCRPVLAVYVEPKTYRYSETLKEGEIFDLSERINGISPIPGFISLKEPKEEEKVCFVPLLGFEGIRFAYLIEQVQPPGDKILPIIGVPGFRPEYPFFTYQGNQLQLIKTRAWKNVRFAMANCPFSLFYVLDDIAKDYSDNLIKIAPIGTKPHALGAVLYNINKRDSVELIYDHPIRKPTRTEGSSRLLVYHTSTFVSSVTTL